MKSAYNLADNTFLNFVIILLL